MVDTSLLIEASMFLFILHKNGVSVPNKDWLGEHKVSRTSMVFLRCFSQLPATQAPLELYGVPLYLTTTLSRFLLCEIFQPSLEVV